MTKSIFFAGPIESAIGQSLATNKVLICFVTNEDEESNKWEEEYLKDEELASILVSNAVTIRLIAGSTEASYLSAFIPMTSIPLVAAVRNGAATDILTGDIEKDEFVQKLQAAISPPQEPADASARVDQIAHETREKMEQRQATTTDGSSSSPSNNSTTAGGGGESSADGAARIRARVAALAEENRRRAAEMRQRQQALEAEQAESGDSSALDEDPELTPNASTTTSGTNSAHDATHVAANVGVNANASSAESPASQAAGLAALAEGTRQRLARLREKQEKENLEAEKKRERMRRDGTKARAEAVEKAKERGQLAYIAEQKKRKEHAAEERRRVLGQIEADKAERKYREQQRKLQEKAMAAEAAGLSDEFTPMQAQEKGKAKQVDYSKECALSFRLMDGSSVRSRFPSDGNIANDVRSWLDKNRTDGDHPYKLRQLQPPKPSKPIESETSSLIELGLTPNSSLILVPIGSRASSAYPTGTNWLVAIFVAIWNIIKTILGVNTNTGSSQGEGANKQQQQQQQQQPADEESTTVGGGEAGAASARAAEARAKRRIRTLHDEDGDNSKNEWYNGNQLDTLPPPKADNDD